MAGLSIPLLSPSRCVLLITDDALCVYDVTSRNVTLLEEVGWRRPDFENTIADLISLRTGGKSILIVNDGVEQQYRKEKIPRITMFDRASLVQRRLGVAFPNYPIKAALELKDKTKKAFSLSAPPKVPTDGQLYLFAAVPASDAFARTMEAINRSGSGISGYSLLPVESSELVKNLADALSRQKRLKNDAIWSVMIGQHHGGGLRQIVTKNGELALTRITPVKTPDEADTEVWCTEVSQEFQATLSYLSRFGYNPDDGLNVMVIANPDLGNHLESFINTSCNYFTTTTPQAGHILNIPLGRGTDNHYADPLHVGWIGRKPVSTMPLRSRELDKIANPRKIAASLLIVLSLVLGYVGYACSNEALAIYGATKNYEIAVEQRAEIEKIYRDELKRKEEMGIDVKMIQGALAIDDEINRERIDPLPLLEVISGELKNLRMDGFEYINLTTDMRTDLSLPLPATAVPRSFDLILKFSFAGTVLPQDGNAEIRQLVDRLNDAIPGYEVSVKKDLVDLTYKGAITDETGLTAKIRKASDRYLGEILIKKKHAGASVAGTVNGQTPR